MANEILDRLGITAENYKAPKKRENDTLDNGVLGHFIDATQAGASNVLSGQFRTLGEYAPLGNRELNKMADYFEEVAQANTPTQELSGLDYGAQAVGNAVGSGGITMAEAFLASKLAGPLGANAVLASAKGAPVIGGVARGLGNLASNNVGKAILASAGGGVFEVPAEMGSVINEMRNRGASKEEVDQTALRSGLANLGYAVGSGLLEATALGKITGAIGDVAKKGKYDVAKSAGLGALTSGADEFTDETIQSAISDWSKGDPIDWANAIEEGKMGAIGGIVLGGAGAGIGRYVNKLVEEEEAKKLLNENPEQEQGEDSGEPNYGVEKPDYTPVNTGEFPINPAELRVARQQGLDNEAGDKYARLMSTLADRPHQTAVEQAVVEQPIQEPIAPVVAPEANIAVRGERGLGQLGTTKQSAPKPSGNVPANAPKRDYAQELVNRFYGNPIGFRKVFNKAMEAIASAYRMGNMTQEEAQERANALTDLYNRVIEPIKNGVGREQTAEQATVEQQPQMIPQNGTPSTQQPTLGQLPAPQQPIVQPTTVQQPSNQPTTEQPAPPVEPTQTPVEQPVEEAPTEQPSGEAPVEQPTTEQPVQQPTGEQPTGTTETPTSGTQQPSSGGTTQRPSTLTPKQREEARKRLREIAKAKTPKAIVLKALIDRIKASGITLVTDPEEVIEHLKERGYNIVGGWDSEKGYIIQDGLGTYEWHGSIDVRSGVMYLDVSLESIDTAIHEYTHMWNYIMKATNPELWKRGVELVKGTSLWREIASSPAYAGLRGNEDAIADEVLCRFVGPNGEQVLTQMAIGESDPQTFIKRVRNWIKDFWYALKNVFANWGSNEAQSLSLEEFQRLPLKDLFKGTNLVNLSNLYDPAYGPYKIKDTSLTMEEAKEQATKNQEANKQREEVEESIQKGNVKDTSFGDKGSTASSLLGDDDSTTTNKPTKNTGESASGNKGDSTKSGSKGNRQTKRVTQSEDDIMGELGGLFSDSLEPLGNFQNAVTLKFNPKIVTAISKLGMLKYDNGFTNYAEWRKSMLDTLGQNANVLAGAKPWIGAVWKAIEKFPAGKAFNDSKMASALDFVGASFKEGNFALDDVVQDFKNTTKCTDAQLANVMPYLESAYNGIREYNIPTLEGGAENDSDSGQEDNQPDIIGGETEDEDGATDESRRPDDSSGSGSETIEEDGIPDRGTTGVSRSGNASGGTRTAGEGEREISDAGSSASDGDSDSDSGDDSESGLRTDGQRSGTTGETVENGQIDDEDLELENTLMEKVNKAMKFLTDLQKDNVVATIKRMFYQKLQSLLLTDGTGTGKTFSGLATVKSAIDEYGAKRVLILAPTQTVCNQWQDTAKNKGFNIKNAEVLADTNDGGKEFTDANGKRLKDQKGIYITTYANFRDNEALFSHKWDMVVCDEAHNLMKSISASDTAVLTRMRALTFNKRGLEERAYVLYAPQEEKDALEKAKSVGNALKKVQADYRKRMKLHEDDKSYPAPPTPEDYLWFDDAKKAMTLLGYESPSAREQGYNEWLNSQVNMKKMSKAEAKRRYDVAIKRIADDTDNLMATAKLAKENAEQLSKKGMEERNKAPYMKEWREMAVGDKPKVLFLSATPFTYDRATDWAEGYLFDYDPPTEASPNPQWNFLRDTFGYTIEGGELYKPDPKNIDTTENEIAFHENLRKQGALRGEILNIDKDYSRGFIVTTEDLSDAQAVAIGKFIDAGFKALAKDSKFSALNEALKKQFNWLAKSDLLESLKAKVAMDLAREYVKAGKKVVIVHRRKTDAEVHNPFVLNKSTLRDIEKENPDLAKELKRQMAEFSKKYPEFVKKSFEDLRTALSIFQDEKTGFKPNEAVYFNGDISKKAKQQAVDLFQADENGVDILIGQVNAISEGINFQDTTGKHPRVMINISIPQSPSEFTQIEGRIYRTGNASNAIFRYLSTGTDFENDAWASTVAGRVETAENLSLGYRARNMLRSITKAFSESLNDAWKKYLPNSQNEDVGGKSIDFSHPKDDGFASAVADYNENESIAKPDVSTPEPLGYAMVQWAKALKGEKMLEPSAGNGAISRYFSGRTGNVIIEPENKYNIFAKMHTKNKTFIDGKFEDYNTQIKFEGVVMNPPEISHVIKAFHHLKDGGRIVAVVENNEETAKYLSGWLNQKQSVIEDMKQKYSWFKEDSAKSAYLTQIISLPNIAFERSGKPAMQVVIIDKHNGARLDDVKTNTKSMTEYDDINDFFNALKEMLDSPDRGVPERIPFDDKAQKEMKRAEEAIIKLYDKIQANYSIVENLYGSSFLKEIAFFKDAISAIKAFNTTNYEYIGKKTTDMIPQVLARADRGKYPYAGTLWKIGRKYTYELTYESRKDEEAVANAQIRLMKGISEQYKGVGNSIDTELLKAKIRKAFDKVAKNVRDKAVKDGKTLFADYNDVIIETAPNGERTITLSVPDVIQDSHLRYLNGRFGEYYRGNKTWVVPADVEQDSFERVARAIGNEYYYAVSSYIAKQAREQSNKDKPSDTKFSIQPISLKRAPERNIKEIEAEINASFPNLKNIEYRDTDIIVTLPNDLRIQINVVSDSIIVDEESYIRGKGDHGLNSEQDGYIEGLWRSVSKSDINGMLAVSTHSRIGTTYHEVMHFAMDMCLNEKEKQALYKASAKEAKKTGRDIDEVIADNYRDWVIARQKGRGTAFGKLFQKIQDFLYKVLAMFTTTENAYNVMRKVEDGGIWEREIDPAVEAKVKFSINPKKTLNEKLAGAVVSSTEKDVLPNFKEGGVKTATDWLKGKYREFYTDWVDKNDVLHNIDKAYEEALGRKLGTEERVYDKAQMHGASSAGMADALINGDANAIKAINERLKTKKITNNITLRDVISALDKDTLDKTYPNYLEQLGCKQWYEAFSKYLGWRRLAEMSRLHKEAYTEEVAQWEKDKAEQDDWKVYQKLKKKEYDKWLLGGKQGADPTIAMRENWMKQHGSEAEPHPDLGKRPEFKPYLLPENLTEQDLLEGIRNAPPVFKKASQMYYMFNDNILTIMEDAGMISAELHSLLNRKYKEYCPLMRDFSDTASFDRYIGELTMGGKGYGNVSSTLKRISEEGSERAVISPLESTIKAVAVAMNRAERNKVGQQIVEMAKKAKLDDFIHEIPTPRGGNAVADPNNCIFTVMFDGKKKAFQSSQELYGPIVGYNLPSASFSFGIVRNAAELLRTGATMSPSFVIRNVLRDTVFAGISSQNGFIPFVDTVKGAYALWKNAEMTARFHASGVDKFNFYATDKAIVENLDELAGGKDWHDLTPYELLKASLKYPAMRMVVLSNFMESATRMGEFMRAYENTGDIDVSARASKEITLDFSRSGVYGEQWNQIIPFLNATIQGGDKVIRMLKNHPIATMTNIGKYIILPSIILWCLNHDEEWYEELDPNIKLTNWCIGEYRIPKPQELGVLFGSGIEAMLELAYKEDPKAVSTWAKQFAMNAVPNFVPTVLLPIMEWKANYSFHRARALVGGRYQNLPDELQFTPYTSEASKAVGDTFGLSPIKIDNFVRGHTGTMGMLIWQSTMDWQKEGLPERKWSELPILRDFNVTQMNRSKNVNAFYEMLHKANKEHAGYGGGAKPTAPLTSIRKVGTAISKINKEILIITLNENISPERKRKLIDIRDEHRRKLAKRANEMYGKFFD